MYSPFKPTAGKRPPVLVGRDDDLDAFRMAIEEGPGAPERLLFVTGARGIGKTVMLNALSDMVKERDWFVVNETASVGFTERIIGSLADRDSRTASYTLPSLSLESPLGSLGATLNLGKMQVSHDLAALDLRHAVGERLDRMDEDRQGVLITLDELGAESPMDEVRAFATAVQHLIREDRNVAVVFAGIPGMVNDVVNDRILTFLRRAERFHLQNVDLPDVWEAFEHTISDNGKSADYEVLNLLTEATHGYPFMIQLVGHQAWRASDRNGHPDAITLQDAQEGIEKARDRIGELVNGPAVDGLPPMAREYLLAMAIDDGPSNTGEIARRMHRDAKYASVYRSRLINEDFIKPTDRGFVDFRMPFMREYLRGHAAFYQLEESLADELRGSTGD
ncbi:ATP-binding protein [Bifidobacterium cuniculi]|uniref:AAA ATPase domain protein n=1 Tax=Bifidobacterium cuniculi TaxID=1688 RepID=A0A087B2P6_9BIFI|nr:ATP-binding protein [Bifidobacterium cuniculi]KFI65296.1 AAA ATPase domain protein [Bifidobacterium cuniculi]